MGWSWITGKQKSFRHRSAERHDAHNLHIPNLGELVDLSITGMRVKVPSKPKVEAKQVLPLVICSDGQCVKVTAQVVWVRKASLTGNDYQLGLRFLDVKAGIQSALDQLARFGCITTSASMASMSEPEPRATPQAKPGTSPTNAPSAAHPSQANPSIGATGATSQPPPPVITVEIEDLYANLGLKIGASDSDIRKAYHELAMKYHPDRNVEHGAEDQFRVVAKTYLVLKDPDKRARYDAMLRGQEALHRTGSVAAHGASASDAPQDTSDPKVPEQRIDDMSDLLDEDASKQAA